MKNRKSIIMLLLGLFLTSFALHAQVHLSGSLGMNYVKLGSHSKALTFNVTPKLGFQISDNTVLGGYVGYSGASLNYSSSSPYGYGRDLNEYFDIISVGLYGRFKAVGTENIRLLFEQGIGIAVDREFSDFMANFVAVPVVQIRISEKVFFDTTLGLMGLSIFSVPDAGIMELNFGVNNTGISVMDINSVMGSTITPIQMGFTFVL